MFKIITALIFASTLLLADGYLTSSHAVNKYMFVLAGQSNMVGSAWEVMGTEEWTKTGKPWQTGGSLQTERDAELNFNQAIIDNNIEGRVKYWQIGIDGTGTFHTLKYSKGDPYREQIQMHRISNWRLSGPNLGPYFAAEFLIKLNNPTAEVYLVGVAAESTGFSLTVNDISWSASQNPKHNIQDYMRWHTHTAAKKVPDAEVAGLLWLQGASDSGMTANDYADEVKSMVKKFRDNVTRASDARFLVATVMPTWQSDPANGKYLHGPDEAHRTILTKSKSEGGIDNMELIDTIDMNHNLRYINMWEVRDKVTPLHYSALALRKIGRCFAARALKQPIECEKF